MDLPNNTPSTVAGFTVFEVLGTGAHSVIYAVTDPKTSQVYALKHVVRGDSSDQKFIDQVVNEYEVSLKIDDPHVRRCFELRRKRSLLSTQEVFLLMELVDGQTLMQRRPRELPELIRVFRETARALAAINDAGFVHSDMKPNNVLVCPDGTVKIIDLGQSCPTGTVKQRIQGTPDYIAPEQVRRKPLTRHTDMYNLGAMMYWCVTDHFIPTLIPDENGDHYKGKFHPASYYNPDIPKSLDDTIRATLRSRPVDRPANWDTIITRLDLAILQAQNAGRAKAAAESCEDSTVFYPNAQA